MSNSELIIAICVVVCAAIFLILRENKQERERRERDDMLKRLEDADKPNQGDI